MRSVLLTLGRWGWRLFFCALLALVLTVAGARLLITLQVPLQSYLEQYLERQLATDITFSQLTAQWHEGQPSLSVRNMQLRSLAMDRPGLSLNRLDLSINLRASLMQGTLVFNQLSLDGLSLNLVNQGAGRGWAVDGLPRLGGRPAAPADIGSRLLNWLQRQGSIDMNGLTLQLHYPNGSMTPVNLPYISLNNAHGLQNLNAQLESGEGFITLTGQGSALVSGDWQGAITTGNLDTEAFCATWSGCDDRLLKGIIDSRLSWRYQRGNWQLSGQVTVPTLTYQSRAGTVHKAEGATTVFLQSQKKKGWQLWLDQLTVRLDQQTMALGRWYLATGTRPESPLTLAGDTLVLDELSTLLLQSGLLPERPETLLRVLNPSGILKNPALRLYPQRTPFDFDLQAQLQDVAVAAWHSAPSASQVNGLLRMGPRQGSLQLDSPDGFTLGLDKVFRKVWRYDSAQARLYWNQVDDRYILRGDGIRLKGPEGQLAGQLRLTIPLNNQPVAMGLTVGLKDGNGQYTGKYLPARMPTFSAELTRWLDSAIEQASISEGGFIYNGLLDKDERTQPRWGLFFDLDDTRLNYHPDWPKLEAMSASVYVDNDLVSVQARQGRVLDARLAPIDAQLPLTADPVLSIKARGTLNGQSLNRLLTQTPIDRLMQGQARGWQLSGALAADLQLAIPLDHAQDSRVEVDGQLDDFRLTMPAYRLDIEQITGSLRFSTESGLSSDALEGRLFGQPISTSIHTSAAPQQSQQTAIVWQGRAPMDALSPWLDRETSALLKGTAAYLGDLRINPQQQTLSLSIQSDLEGVAIDLPPPVGKPLQKPQPLTMAYEQARENRKLSLDLAGLGKARFQLGTATLIDQGVVWLGPETDTGQLPEPQPGHITVTGDIPELDITPWYQRFSQPMASIGENSLLNLLQVEELTIDKLRYGERVWEKLRLGFQVEPDYLKLNLDSAPLAGSLWLPRNRPEPYRLALSRLLLPAPGQGKRLALATDISPLAIPAMDIAIESFRIGEKLTGQLVVQLRRQVNGLRVETIDGEVAGMALSGSADWIENEGRQQTYFQGQLKGKQLGQLLTDMGRPSLVQAKDTWVEAALNWPGSPLDVSFAALSGRTALKLKNGRLNKLEAGSGALKLFGIFNTDSLNRRLKLDFSDLYESGVSFDSLNGALRFNRGMITFDEPLQVKGASSHFKVDGQFDGINDNMDVSLVVTLPVTANLPVFSVLLGAAPQVAGMIYLVDKLLGKQVNQLASIRYRIEGPFSEPQVTLDQLFSSKAIKPGGMSKKARKGSRGGKKSDQKTEKPSEKPDEKIPADNGDAIKKQ